MANKSDFNTPVNSVNTVDYKRETRLHAPNDKRHFLKPRTESSTSSSTDLLKIVVIIMLIGVLFSVLNGIATEKTFAGFLEMLRTVPTTSFDWMYTWLPELGDWGIFNPLRDLIDVSFGIFRMLAIFFEGIENCWNLIQHALIYLLT